MRNDASRKLRFTFCYLDEEMGYTYTVDMERRHGGLVEVDRPTMVPPWHPHKNIILHLTVTARSRSGTSNLHFLLSGRGNGTMMMLRHCF